MHPAGASSRVAANGHLATQFPLGTIPDFLFRPASDNIALVTDRHVRHELLALQYQSNDASENARHGGCRCRAGALRRQVQRAWRPSAGAVAVYGLAALGCTEGGSR